MTAFRLLKSLAPPHLEGVVDTISVYRETGLAPSESFEPAGLVVPLLIGFADPFAIGLGRAPREDERYVSFAAGLTHGPAEIQSTGGAHCLQINFTPLGARAFFGLPLDRLTDAMLDPETLLGAEFRAFRERAGNERSWPRRIALAQELVTRRVAKAAPVNAEAAWAYQMLCRAKGAVAVTELAAEMGRSRKHVGQILRDACGLPPKALASIMRFERAHALASGGLALAEIAAETGYADQAHLTRAFRQFSGRSPRQLIALGRL